MLVDDGVDWAAVLAEAEAMSGGQRLLLYAAYDLWEAEGVVGIWELARGLDRSSFERLVGRCSSTAATTARACRDAPRCSLRRRPRLVDVASRDQRNAGDGEDDRPRQEHRAARGGRQEVIGGQPGQGVPCVDRPEAADGGDEGEEEVLDDEAPGEQADDRCDLVADDDAEADADRAPQCDAGERAEHQERGLAAVERVVDATARERGVADPEAEPSPTTPNARPARSPAASFAATTRERLGVNRNVGRIVPKRYSLVTSMIPARAEKMPARPPTLSSPR